MTRRKHILVVSQCFYPEQFRINDICTEWIKKGYKVTVITGIPHTPQGTFHKGYSVFKNTEKKYNGINIIRLPIFPRGSRSIMLALNYLSFVVSGFIWSVFSKVKADYVFIFAVSPMTQALPGIWYAKKKKIPCYLYVQDLWPETIEAVTRINNKYIINLIRKIVDYIYKRSTHIFTTSKSFVNLIHERGVPIKKLEYWPQYPEDFYKIIEKSDIKSFNDKKFNISFTGNIGTAQGLEILAETAVIIKKNNMDRNIIFNIIGDGRYKNDFMKLIESREVLDMFNFIPQQHPTKIPELLSSSDVAFLCLKNEPLFEMTVPAKLQSYMACGMPILASVAGETKRIIEESECGLCAFPGDEEELFENIIKFYNMAPHELAMFGNNAKNYCENNFNKIKLLNIMDKYLQDEYVLED